MISNKELIAFLIWFEYLIIKQNNNYGKIKLTLILYTYGSLIVVVNY